MSHVTRETGIHLLRRPAVALFAFVMAGMMVLAEPARATWQLGNVERMCTLRLDTGDRFLVIALMRISGHRDGGIMSWFIGDDAFDIAPLTATDVTLAFDTGSVEGYRVTPASKGVHEIKMMTYRLSDIFDKMEGAATLTIKSGKASATFDIAGFDSQLSKLQQCAESRM